MFRSVVRSSAVSRASSLRSLTAIGLRASAPRSIRMISTVKATPDDAQAVLVAQRKNRPLSPDLEIYQPQLTWYLSGLHRITGLILAGPLYLGLISYAVLPIVGVHVTAAGLAATFGALPFAVKLATKFALAFPFAFHCWNGVRHLVWDTCRALTLKGVYQTGYTVLGLAAVSTLALALL